MKVNISRVMKRIDDISKFNNCTEDGISRFSYSKEDRKARDWIEDICNHLGLTFKVDGVGNIRARYGGDGAPILIGSHIDSVKNGGKYDGIVGVIGALEVLSVMVEENYKPLRPIELIIFAEEEGSNFGTTMVGSKSLIGKLSYNDLNELHNEKGISALEIMENFSLNPLDMKNSILKDGDIFAMVELHIEQGIVLEREGLDLGIVNAIAGMTTLDVTVTGTSNHAGSTPMTMRNDALVASSELFLEIEKIASSINSTTVATVGTIDLKPNMPNVIPGKVKFSIDIRDIDNDSIKKAEDLIKEFSKTISKKRNVKIDFETIGSSKAIKLSDLVIDEITKVVKSTTTSWMSMHSGAVHDAAMIAEIAPVGMIFVPSRNGISHNKDEYTDEKHIEMGVQVLLDTAMELSQK